MSPGQNTERLLVEFGKARRLPHFLIDRQLYSQSGLLLYSPATYLDMDRRYKNVFPVDSRPREYVQMTQRYEAIISPYVGTCPICLPAFEAPSFVFPNDGDC